MNVKCRQWPRVFVVGSALIAGIAVGAAAQSSAPTPVRNGQGPAATAPAVHDRVVATFSLGQVTEQEVDRRIAVELARLHEQIYDAKTRAIRRIVVGHLLQAEALKEGLTQQQLFDKYVQSRITEPAEAEVEQVLKQYRSQLPKDEKAAKKLVRQALKDRQRQRLEKQLEARLLRDADLKILLEAPRFPVTVSKDDPVRGAANAPVTIVEFSDFQCPFCARVQPTLHRILKTYGDRVRIVFKNMPGRRHDRARPAAEAALCAGRQGMFWQMHDWLYAHQGALDDASLKAAAKKLGLEMDAFSTCLSKHETAPQVNEGLAEARRLGLTGTPIFFVNGRMIRGAQPFAVFDGVIRSELERLGMPLPTPAAGVEKAPASVPATAKGPGHAAPRPAKKD